MRMPFGKHRGADLADVPLDYLLWVVNKCDSADDELLEAVNEELDNRIADPAKRKARQEERAQERPQEEGPKYKPPPPDYRRKPCNVNRDRCAEIVAAGRRTLAARHHPDAGGDLAIMQEVNACADWLLEYLNRL